MKHLHVYPLSFSGKLDWIEFLFLIVTDLSNDGDINEMFSAQMEINWKENK